MLDTSAKSGKAAFAAALAAVVVGGSVLAGWMLDVQYPGRILPGQTAMNPATAVAFILTGLSLALLLRFSQRGDQKSRGLILTARLCACAVILIGLARLAAIFSDLDLGVDQWLFASKMANGLEPRNHLAPNTALDFLLLGGAVLLMDMKSRPVRCGVEFAAAVVGLVSLLAFLGHAYGVQPLYRIGPFGAMAAHTAITFAVLSAGILLSHTDTGFLAMFAGNNTGGTLARRLLPAAVVITALVNWLSRLGEAAGFPVAFCDAAETVANISVLAFLICWTAQRLYNADVRGRAAEAAKRESEESFAIALEYAPIGFAVLSPEGRWLKVNPALCELVGYSEAEMLARTFRDITPTAEIEVGQEEMRRLVTGETRSCELQKHYVHRRGHLVAVSIHISLVRDGQGQPRYFIAQTQDITERKRTDFRLRRDEQRYRSLVEATTAIVWDTPASGEFVVEQPGWTALTGQSFAELRGWGWLKAVHPDDQADTGRVWSAAVESRSIYKVEHRLRARNGTYRNMMVRAVPILAEDGTIHQWIGTHTDITERKQAEAWRMQLAAIVESSEDAIVSKDLNSNVTSWNAAAERMFGYPAREMVGASIRRLIPPDRQAEEDQIMSSIQRGEPVLHVETRRQTKSGTMINVSVTVSPIKDAAGNVVGASKIARDITERKRIETALRESEERYRALIEWSPEPIIVQRDGILLFVNPATVRMMGANSPLDLVGRPSLDFVQPDSRHDFLELRKTLPMNNKGDHLPLTEQKLVRLDGRVIDVETQGTVIAYDGGPAIYGSVRDITERKRADAELRWKTAFLEAQVNSSLDGILVVDGQGKKLVQNQRFTNLLKIPQHIADDRDDEKQVLWVTGMTKDPAAFVVKVAHLSSHPEETSRDEIELADGTILDRYSAPATGSDGAYFGRIWTFRDITERTRSEASLLESQQRLALATDSADIGIWDWDVVENKMVWDARMLALYGLRPQDFTGAFDAWQNGLHPEDREEAEAGIAAALAGTQEFQSEFRVVWPSGEVHDIQAYGKVQRAADGSAQRVVGVNWDITARKRIESRYRRLVESNVQGILFWTVTGGITGANDAFLSLVGYSREDLEAGRIDWMAMTPPEYAHLDRRALEDIATRGSSALYEKEFIRKDGSRAPILLGSTAFEDDPDAGVCFVLDLTDRKRLETQLLESQKLETVGKLAGGIAHEFNSILTAIICQSELLLADLPSGSPLSTNATEITKAAGRAAALTRQLLAYGRKQLLQPEALDLNRVVMRMEGMLRHLMGGEIDTRIVAVPGLHAVKADASQLEQVIMQVAINARDAMPNGGKFTLETANVSFDQESVGNYPELKPGDYVMLAITDTGQGMSAETKARLFEPFFSTKGVGQGTGLGLSTCYGIIKQSGGHISVYSEPGRGAAFKIYLPQVEQPRTAAARRPTPTDLPRGTETILLVEDDPALREMASALLRRLGYTVLAAANGIEALSLKQQRGSGHVDLLFADVVMPHMSGIELADRVRELYPHTRVLYTSAYIENAMAHQDVLSKGTTLLQKPFMPSALAYKVREVLDQPHGENALQTSRTE